ncbi:Asp23/Gls24 family envelope stress response protein [Mycolicibacterium komossense]|uniref:Asp23/Gls24 family envelope stress response protein n=1 Tax=Mycolicibacterium komossense TaxID=1779 RepID=A0ABT3CEW8_9MYCO|nr:Asp23/Gls24 family envelope stress response protein [Mycolicibacterium komossense]MCV7228020.1 Asp23/Gls24 family envelope stress response protein [Mycolicibacterium komossense]
MTDSEQVGTRPDLADTVAAAVSAVDGVAELHGGMFGEAATYLPGRRVPGIRFGDRGTEIHVSLLFGYPLRPTAEAVRDAVAPLVAGPVHVTVEDVVRRR